jgi:hypothetical protein
MLMRIPNEKSKSVKNIGRTKYNVVLVNEKDDIDMF